MHVAMLNPQGNFDPQDSYWTEHPDFGGQLVYVKEISLAMAEQGHRVDILTRQIVDEAWPEFSDQIDHYPGEAGVRIVRLACGPQSFLPKEQLWPYLGNEWINRILAFYQNEGRLPDVFSTHYADGGLCGAILQQKTGVPFTFTGHSLGAQKMDKLGTSSENLKVLDDRFLFRRRLVAERIAMNHASRIITSTRQEQQHQYAHRAYRDAVDVSHQECFAIVPPGVNRRVFSPVAQRLDHVVAERIEQAVKRDLPPERKDLPLVICSSRLDRKKNHIGLVNAFIESAELRKRSNLALVVRGLENPLQECEQLQGEEREILNRIAQNLERDNLRGVVTSFPLNSQAELAAAYRIGAMRRSVFALTALYEPFGLAPLEAMSCGLPAVVTQNGGPSESLYDGQTQREYGVLVNPEDSQAIAQGLLRLLSSTSTWKRFHEAGLERVESRYTWESTAKGYLSVFAEVIKSNRHQRQFLPIPTYFEHPTEEDDISCERLAELYL